MRGEPEVPVDGNQSIGSVSFSESSSKSINLVGLSTGVSRRGSHVTCRLTRKELTHPTSDRFTPPSSTYVDRVLIIKMTTIQSSPLPPKVKFGF